MSVMDLYARMRENVDYYDSLQITLRVLSKVGMY